MSSKPQSLFYGCWVVLTAAIGLFLGSIPIAVFSFGVFLRPLAQEFHSGRGAISLTGTLFTTLAAFGMPLAGRLVDRFGARTVIVVSTCLPWLPLGSVCFRSLLPNSLRSWPHSSLAWEWAQK